jgi:DNA polymerase
MLIASPGYEFIAADFSQIEARVLAWIAGQTDLVELFRSGGKIYETMAAYIFGKEVHEITKDSFERQIGKNSILGAGFQMGPDRFAEQVREQTGIVLDRGSWKARCLNCSGLLHFEGPYMTKTEMNAVAACCEEPKYASAFRDREDMAAKAIDGYRQLNSNIVQFWWAIEDAAITAVKNPGMVTRCGIEGKIKFMVRGDFLYCRLPSGRHLAYAKPSIEQRALPEPNQHIIKDTLTFRGIDTFTRQWGRVYSYGGHLTENVVQAMARDLMADAMLRVERAGYMPVLTVHDEVVCEQLQGERSLQEFVQLVSYVPAWATGLPVAAEGWVGERYRK